MTLSRKRLGTMEHSLPDLLTREEFAARARCSPRKASQLLHSMNGPRVTKIGGTVFVRVDHFRDWLDRQVVSHGAQPGGGHR
jgi:hypothetical protein